VMRFLGEVARTLAPGGVLRLSTPGLRGVLNTHYRGSTFEAAVKAGHEAFTTWGHHHFFCEESLELIAMHLGFRSIEFVEFGRSAHAELRGLETRPDQQGLNLYAEITR